MAGWSWISRGLGGLHWVKTGREAKGRGWFLLVSSLEHHFHNHLLSWGHCCLFTSSHLMKSVFTEHFPHTLLAFIVRCTEWKVKRRNGSVAPKIIQFQKRMCNRKVHFYLFKLQCCQLLLLNAVKLLLVGQVEAGHRVVLRSVWWA